MSGRREEGLDGTIYEDGRQISPRPVPLGVMPLAIWIEKNPEPSERALRDRRTEVALALVRYLAAGLPPLPEWLEELDLAAAVDQTGETQKRVLETALALFDAQVAHYAACQAELARRRQ